MFQDMRHPIGWGQLRGALLGSTQRDGHRDGSGQASPGLMTRRPSGVATSGRPETREPGRENRGLPTSVRRRSCTATRSAIGTPRLARCCLHITAVRTLQVAPVASSGSAACTPPLKHGRDLHTTACIQQQLAHRNSPPRPARHGSEHHGPEHPRPGTPTARNTTARHSRD